MLPCTAHPGNLRTPRLWGCTISKDKGTLCGCLGGSSVLDIPLWSLAVPLGKPRGTGRCTWQQVGSRHLLGQALGQGQLYPAAGEAVQLATNRWRHCTASSRHSRGRQDGGLQVGRCVGLVQKGFAFCCSKLWEVRAMALAWCHRSVVLVATLQSHR